MTIIPRSSPGAACGIDQQLIDAVVVDFYSNVREDPLLGPLFAERVKDWTAHEELIGRFWSGVLLMSGAYKGTPLQAHQAIPDLTDAHFDRWLALFGRTVSRHCTTDQAALFSDRAHRIADSFKMARMRIPVAPHF